MPAGNSVAENLAAVRERVQRAVAHCGRAAEEIRLVAVSKTFSVEKIREAYEAGVRHFGENRVQEWEEKREALGDLQATWHLVGHLQSNKARRAAEMFHSVDAVDDGPLAKKLNQAAGERAVQESGRQLRVLIEVRVAEEPAKSGAAEEDVPALAEQILTLPHLELAGLMCVPPLLEDAQAVRPYFSKLREIRDALSARLRIALPVLSMGMSHDFEVAIEEGATEVRLGTALFGGRD
jgi:hypothetical protein